MPYRVAGRKAPDRPARLDAVLLAAVAALGPRLAEGRPGPRLAEGQPGPRLAEGQPGPRLAEGQPGPHLAEGAGGGPRRLALAGASMGSRVAVRTAKAAGARGVVALGFPLVPPGERPSRAAELAGAGVPVLVVQGERDSFGRPAADLAARREVAVVVGADHSFKVRVKDGRSAADVVDEAAGRAAAWLLASLGLPGAGASAAVLPGG
jgi:predicted alpha/beta-hydrolase family hydrolase